MRIRGGIAALVAGLLATLGHVNASATIPLRWIEKQAYVTNVTIDGQATLLQVGTYDYFTWVACSRFGDFSCDRNRSVGSMAVENGYFDVSYLKSKTLTVDSVAYANTAWILRAEYNASMASRLPLVGNETQGVLGLGPNNNLSYNQSNGSSESISVYLSTSSDGAGSFVQIGGATSFTAKIPATAGTTTRYSLSLRPTDEPGWRDQRWYLSLIGVRFGDNKPMYPRVYDAFETVGDDAKALVSLNHATLQMPAAVHARFMAMYLSGCDGYKSPAIGWYYECGLSLMNSLPRLSLYVADKVFFLDPTDYTYELSTDSQKLVVLIAPSGLDDSWFLGTPFLRKFPTIFSKAKSTIDVLCTVGSSCRVQGDVLDRQLVNAPQSSQDGSGSGSSGGGFGPSTTYRPPITKSPSYPSSPTGNKTEWIMWIIKCMGFLMAFILVVRSVRRCRGTRRLGTREAELEPEGPSGDTGTVASERDLEETKEELRRMQAEEEATATAMAISLNDGNYTALQSPGGQRMTGIRS